MKSKIQLQKRQLLIQKLINSTSNKQRVVKSKLHEYQQRISEIEIKKAAAEQNMMQVLREVNNKAIIVKGCESFSSYMDYLDECEKDIDQLETELKSVVLLKEDAQHELIALSREKKALNTHERENGLMQQEVVERELDAISLINWLHKERVDV